MEYRYAYLFGVLVIGLPIWLSVYFLRKDLRRELLMMSLFGLLITPPLVYWYTRDYWTPETVSDTWLGVADLLFGAMVTGVSAVVYQVLFRRKYAAKHLPSRIWIIPVFVLYNVFAYFLNFISPVKINSIYLTAFVSATLAVNMVFIRGDLVRVSLLSGLLSSMIWLACYLLFLPIFPDVFTRWWMLHNLSGITFLDIPIEEFFWSLSWGMFAGPLYKFTTGKTIS